MPPEIESEVRREARQAELRPYLREYLDPKEAGAVEAVEKIVFVEAARLPERHRRQFEFAGDGRLAETLIAVVPKKAWVKGAQPSESHVEKDLILFEDDYFDGADDLAWLSHELAHVAKFKDGAEEYRKASETAAVAGTEAVYPNNEVERAAFKKQFAYLKSAGVSRERVRELMAEQYAPEDLAVLDRWLVEVFG